ncbi:MAG: hypothetical protein JSW47_15230 [Phycisphaerales bacterium]|nr:MAG: hypothetical protein JSW47_15230 [Phycisphaerales bacterium]
MNIVDQINSHEYLYLVDISEPEPLTLQIVVAEAEAIGPPHDIEIDDGEVLKEACEIQSTQDCHLYRLLFDSYIVYTVLNESYDYADQSAQYSGKWLRTYTKSWYLDYTDKHTLACDEHPGPYKHYGIICLDHIIDVTSCSEPSIEMIEDNQSAS